VVQSLADAAPAFPEGPGGDCAHLPTTGGRALRASTIDSVLLGRHFDAACDGIRAGAKLVNRNLSDLAAAGAVPSDALLSLVIGPDVDAAWLTDFAHGAGRAAAKAGLRIVGGDVCRGAPGSFLGTLAVQGFAHRVLTRRTAAPGDVLFVTGLLGGSLQHQRHLTFRPRLDAAQWLADNVPLSALMDISDGLATDLPRMMLASRTAAVLEAALIPIHSDVPPLPQEQRLQAALNDGEDFELLLAVPAAAADLLLSAPQELRFHRVGTVHAGSGVQLRLSHGQLTDLPAGGWQHRL